MRRAVASEAAEEEGGHAKGRDRGGEAHRGALEGRHRAASRTGICQADIVTVTLHDIPAHTRPRRSRPSPARFIAALR